jgi:hypothetical protein
MSRHRGKDLTPEEQRMMDSAKGHNHREGGPGAEGNVEIADPHQERGIQHGYGKNQDKEQEKKTSQGKAQGAQPLQM